MDCGDVRAAMMLDRGAADPDARAHAGTCAGCSSVAARSARLDTLLSQTLLVDPPLDLQASLLAIARTHARVDAAPLVALRPAGAAWRLAPPAWLDRLRIPLVWKPGTDALGVRMVALLSLSLAVLQVLGWVEAAPVFARELLLAVQLVAASPALPYLPDVQGWGADVQSLAVWLGVGAVGWGLARLGLVEGVPPRRPAGSPS